MSLVAVSSDYHSFVSEKGSSSQPDDGSPKYSRLEKLSSFVVTRKIPKLRFESGTERMSAHTVHPVGIPGTLFRI